MNSNMRSYVAEAIGTFFLCFCGIAAIVANQAPINSGSGLVGIALAHGLALSIAINCFGGVSGAHFNPAVTVAMLVTGRIPGPKAVFYIVSQLVGATIGAFLVAILFPIAAVKACALGTPLPPDQPWVSAGLVIGVEIVLTYLLITAIFGTAVDERGKAVKIGAFGIGLTLTAAILACGPITGASLNPARSFGPALVCAMHGINEDPWKLHWCYWVGPIAGAVLGALIYDHLILEKPAKPEHK